MFDYHVHSTYSADSQLSMEDACARALQFGLKEIAFTDHLDIFYPNSDLHWEFDISSYGSSIEHLRQKYGPALTIIKGIEVGMHRSSLAQSKEFTDRGEFDFIIGSVHIADDLDLYNGDFFRGKTLAQALEIYYETVNSMVKSYQDFNVLGHLDLIKRYLHHLDCCCSDVDWPRYDEYVEDTLKHLIQSGRGIEVNMSGYKYNLDCSLPDLRILKLYKSLGGEIITLGSDAHAPEFVAAKFQWGLEMLHDAGFKYISTFRNRQANFVPLQQLQGP